MFCMQRLLKYTSKTGALSVLRTKEDCQNVPCTVTTQDEDKNKEVMHFAGPQMIWYHPIWTLKHLWRNDDHSQIGNFSTITCKIPQYILIKSKVKISLIFNL